MASAWYLEPRVLLLLSTCSAAVYVHTWYQFSNIPVFQGCRCAAIFLSFACCLPFHCKNKKKRTMRLSVISTLITITRIPANTKITSKAFWVLILHCVLWIILLKCISKSTELSHWWNTEYHSLQISEVLLSHLCVPVCFNL